jgi:hypothetical protein
MSTQKTIDQLVKGVLEELNSQGYSQGSIQRYSRSYQRLMEYTNSQGITLSWLLESSALIFESQTS